MEEDIPTFSPSERRLQRACSSLGVQLANLAGSREEANQSQPGFFEVHWTSVESQPSVPTASVSAGHYVMLDPLLHRVQLLKT